MMPLAGTSIGAVIAVWEHLGVLKINFLFCFTFEQVVIVSFSCITYIIQPFQADLTNQVSLALCCYLRKSQFKTRAVGHDGTDLTAAFTVHCLLSC